MKTTETGGIIVLQQSSVTNLALNKISYKMAK